MNTINIKTIIIFSILLMQTLFAQDNKTNESNQKITLQLQWKHQFQFAGYYIAKEKGFYEELGIDVNIKEFDYSVDIIKDVLNGKTHFATGRSSLVVNKSYGDKITLLAAIFQASADVLIATKESKIFTINDFKNKKIMITGDAKNDLVYKSMLFSQNISTEDMKVLKHSFNIEDLVNKKTDLMASYISNEPFRLKEEYGLDSVIFDPKDYGFDFYGDILFTNEQFVKEQPMLIKDFTKASLKGWKYAFDNIEESVEIILDKYNTQNKSKEALIFEAKELKKLAYYKTKELGKIEKMKIQRIYDAYKLMGIVKANANFDGFIFRNLENKLNLNNNELLYLKNKKEFNLCIDPDWMPFEKFDKTGKHIGLSADYFEFFKKQLEVDIKAVNTKTWSQTLEFMKNKQCDILSLAMPTPNRIKYMSFTSTYLKMPLVLATKLNVTFVDNFSQLRNKKVAIVKDYAYAEIIKYKYPNLKLKEVKNTKEGLKKVENEEVFAFIGSIADISYFTQKDFLGELKIAGKFHESLNLSIGIRKDEPLLHSIFEKLVLAIPQSIKEKITNKHLAIKYEQKVDYTLFWRSTIIFITIVLIGIYWMYTLKKEKKRTELLLTKLEFAKDQLKDKNKELKRIAITDKLTRLYNRVKLDEALLKEIQRAKRYKHPFGLIIVDIDDFKIINDTYGHQVGDKVLIELAKILLKDTRQIDLCGRWGGEEFMIICPETNEEGTYKLATILKDKIQSHKFKDIGQVTASFGVAQFNQKDSFDSVILKADKALYNAKRDGKNCVRTVLKN